MRERERKRKRERERDRKSVRERVGKRHKQIDLKRDIIIELRYALCLSAGIQCATEKCGSLNAEQ